MSDEQLAAIEARAKEPTYTWAHELREDRDALLALVREQQAKLQAIEGLCSEWDAVVDVFPLTPAALFAGSHAKRVRAALTATEG
jgi:hypothetical protein